MNDPDGRPRSRPNLAREVASYVRDQILGGRLRPAERIDQEAIAAALGVSRLPVREALIALEAEGMVENRPRRGSYVASITPDDISDLYLIYGVTSGIAASRAAVTGDAALISQLRDINRRMRESSDPADYDTLNYTFHRTINRAGGSQRLLLSLRTLSRSMPTDFFATNSEPEFRLGAVREHNEIIDLIEQRRADEAAKAVADHFAHTADQAIKALRATGFWHEDP